MKYRRRTKVNVSEVKEEKRRFKDGIDNNIKCFSKINNLCGGRRLRDLVIKIPWGSLREWKR